MEALSSRWDRIAVGDPFDRDYFDVYCEDTSVWGRTEGEVRTAIVKECSYVASHYLFGRRLPKPLMSDFNKSGVYRFLLLSTIVTRLLRLH